MQSKIDLVGDTPRWRRKPDQRPKDILDGALTEFRAKGFKGARIEDIAAQAGLSKGSVYLYFDSKEDILKALVDSTVKPITEALNGFATQSLIALPEAPLGNAANTLRTMLHFAANKILDPKISAVPLMIIAEAGNFPEFIQTYRDEVMEIVMAAVESVISKGISSGEFRKLDPHLTMRSLMGIMIMQIIWNGVFLRANEKPIPAEELMNAHIDLFLNGACAHQEN
jgi:AcrR family transcriptional regulator